jgi:hypothetical protein
MRTYFWTAIVLLSLTTGCEQFHLFVDEDTAVDTGEDLLTPNPSIDVTWADGGIEIVIDNGTGFDFQFGIVESSQSCSIDTEYGCWTAEDCINGYITPQDTFAHAPYCHPMGDSGATLAYSESLIDVITSTTGNLVVPGVQTGFPMPTEESTYEFEVTYYLKAVSTGANPTEECWTWGVDPDHFSDAGCKAPIPIRLDWNTNGIFPVRQRLELPLQSQIGW